MNVMCHLLKLHRWAEQSYFLGELAQLNVPLVLSTGMGSFEEIQDAVSILEKRRKDLVILHCTSIYPSDQKLST